MASTKQSTFLYIIIAVLVMALAASIGYNIGNAKQQVTVQPASMNAINAKVLHEIEDLKQIYDSKIAEKTATYQDLETEKEKVQSLMAELEKTKGDAQAMVKYKEQYQNLEAKMRLLVDEIVTLKTNKSKAVTTTARKSKPFLAEGQKPKISTKALQGRNAKSQSIALTDETVVPKAEPVENKKIEIPERKAEKTYANLAVTGLRAGGFISKSASVKEETNSASKTDLIKINFSLEANEQAKAEEKKYFIQIVDGNNKVLGKRITEFFDDKSITYSLSRSIQYENQYLPVTLELVGEAFQKGTYTVNVYERSRLVGKTTFTLK